MEDFEEVFERDAEASLSNKICSICGKRLSKYNKLGRCFHHPDPAQERRELEREARLAARVEKKRPLLITQEEKRIETTVTLSQPEEECPSIDRVTELTCNLLEVSFEEVKQKCRQTQIVRARHILMYLLYTDTPLTYPAIGALLGGRDHTTVIHGVSKITDEIETNPDLKGIVQHLRSKYFMPLT